MSTKTIQLMDPYPTSPSTDTNHESFEKITGLPTPKVTPRTSLRTGIYCYVFLEREGG